MILIVVKQQVKPEYADRFMDMVRPFSEATRAEEGNLFFEWSRSVEDPHQFVLVEGFKDDAAEAHVNSDHFAAGLEAMREALVSTPKIISRQVEGEGWDEMGELKID
ncbi:putative quinol monooxygenase [Citricoccus sp. GCM10030269]|uniref:putative quinol monooxygenase n=1 Tax=Citricoccus sp. GCM10030269 TaxID=3273388 RepID=UPI0036155D03